MFLLLPVILCHVRWAFAPSAAAKRRRSHFRWWIVIAPCYVFFSVCFRLLPQRQKSFERESLDNKNFFFFFADADHQTSGRDAHTKRRLHSQLSEIDFFFSFSFSLLLTFVGNSPLLHPIYKARGKQCGGCSSASLRFRWVTLLSHCQKRIPHMSS